MKLQFTKNGVSQGAELDLYSTKSRVPSLRFTLAHDIRTPTPPLLSAPGTHRLFVFALHKSGTAFNNVRGGIDDEVHTRLTNPH